MRLTRLDIETPSKADRAAFSCGTASLDRWLATQARQRVASREAVTYLLIDDAAGSRIAGYFCLSAGEVRKEHAPAPIARHAPQPIPVIRMGRFAIDRRYQGAGWGASMLAEALLSAVHGGRLIAARALLVDAIDERAASFYERFGFMPSPIHPLQLLYDLRTIEVSAGLR